METISLFSLVSKVFAWGHHWQALCHHMDLNTVYRLQGKGVKGQEGVRKRKQI